MFGRIPGQRWQYVWRDRRDLEPIAGHVPLNRATVALAVRGHSTVYGISPERLLPPSDTTSPPSAALAYLLELYRADGTSLMETEARRNRVLRHLVESEAYAELGRSSPWRSMEEILYEVGVGARLDGLFANPTGLPYEHVEASVEGSSTPSSTSMPTRWMTPRLRRAAPRGPACSAGLRVRGLCALATLYAWDEHERAPLLEDRAYRERLAAP